MAGLQFWCPCFWLRRVISVARSRWAGLMMVVGAFYQVGSALRWFVDKFPAIAEWRAMLARISLYREALQRLPLLDGELQEIRYECGAPTFSIEDLCIFAPNGAISLSQLNLKIEPGERVLIEATPKSGKSIFLKALAAFLDLGDRNGSAAACGPPPFSAAAALSSDGIAAHRARLSQSPRPLQR